MMKILWFANTPCGASEKLVPNLVVGGWLSSLQLQLEKNSEVELHVCFYWNRKLEPFEIGKTKYYPVFRKNTGSKLERLVNRAIGSNNDSNEVLSLLEIVNQVSPALIHIHGSEENFGLIKAGTNIPIVISIQGILLPYIEKYYSGIPKIAAILNERILSKMLFTSTKAVYKNLFTSAKREEKIFSLNKFYIGRTGWDRRVSGLLAYEHKYFSVDEIIRPNFYLSKWNKSKFEDKLQIVTTMSGGLYKGLEVVVKTAALLVTKKAINFEWIVIGQTEKNDLSVLVKKWLKVNYKSINIKLVGAKNEVEVVNVLLNSDIFCQVSHIENSPNSLCEAMLIGMPIIASFAGGTDSMLENNKEGVLVQDGDYYSLAGAIIEISADFNKAKELGSNASKRAHIRHAPEKIVKELLAAYNEIIDSEN